MTGVLPGERTGPSEVGWSAFAGSVPALLLGRGGALAFFVLWLIWPYIPLDRLQNTLIHALVPLAVMFGFGLQRFQEIDHLIRSRTSGIGAANRGRVVQVVFAYGGTVTALAAVLAYSLLPLEVPLWNRLPPDIAAALDVYPELTLVVASLVLLPVVLIARYPFFAADPVRLVEALDRPSMEGHWKQRRKARYRDTLVLLVLVFVGVFVLAVLGGQLPGDASLVGLALVGFAYEGVCALFRGCTVGKWRRGVCVVVGLDDDPVSRGRALARAAVLYAPLLVLGILRLDAVLGPTATVLNVPVMALYGLGMAHPHGRGFHDLVAGTRVITPSDPPSPPPDTPLAVEAVPVEPGVLRLPRPELEATPDDPFRHDKLERQPHVEALCYRIEATVGHPVVMIDAGWGAGKTAFMTMCQAYLASRGRQVVSYNAWRTGYTQQPLFDLVAAMATELPSPEAEAMVKSAADVSSWRSFWTELRSPQGTVAVDLSELPAETHRVVDVFQEQLKKVAAAKPGPLVVLIDELDRCRPTYAVETLEVIRHLFTVDGVVVVVAVNANQLVEAVKGLYGQRFNAVRYLRRFVDLRVPLRPTFRETRAPFLARLLTETGLADHVVSTQRCHVVLDLVAQLPDTEIRDIEYAAHLAAVVLSSEPPPDLPHDLWEWFVLAVVLLRTADVTAYSKFVRAEIDGFEAAAAVNDVLPKFLGDPGNDYMVTRDSIDATLVYVAEGRNWQLPDYANDFLTRYENAGGTPERAQRVLDTLGELVPHHVRLLQIWPWRIAELMDMAVYDPATPRDPSPLSG